MLIINGTAEFMLENGAQTKGDKHGFNMFSNNDNLQEQLIDIESYLVARGWDNIEIINNGIIGSISEIKHDILLQAFNKAQDEGISAVVHNTPH
jgi:hypothetical protein